MTQDVGYSHIEYAWAILFDNDKDAEKPFLIVPLKIFENTDFPFKAVEGIMSPGFRAKVWTFSNFPGRQFRIFAKIERGTSSARRQKELDRLNVEFQTMARLKISQTHLVEFFIEAENYRMLSTQQYSWQESPLRSARLSEKEVIVLLNYSLMLMLRPKIHFYVCINFRQSTLAVLKP